MKTTSQTYSPFAIAVSAMFVAFVWSMVLSPSHPTASSRPLPAVARAAGGVTTSN